MKSMKSENRVFSTVLSLTLLCIGFGLFSPANAAGEGVGGLVPSGFGYTYGDVPVMNEAGKASIHDSNMMRYDKNSRLMEGDFERYENLKDQDGSDFVNDYTNGGYGAGAGTGSANDPYKAIINEANSQGVYVNSIEVSPSSILSAEEINRIISQYVGRNVYMSDIQKAIDEINDLYAEKGFVTARAYLPEQTVTNGNIKIDLIESRIGKITVEDNKYTTDKYILKRMPEKEGELFDIVSLEKDVLDFNRYHDGVNLSANLKAGEVPGTTDIELKAHETFPFHIIGMMDNAGRRSTGSLRGGPAIVVDSLFHRRDQMSMGAYFGGGSISPFFDYSVPINKKDGRIGFSFSSTFSNVKYGPAYLTSLGLKSNSYIYSLYYDQPIVRKRGFEFKTYAALNYKRARTWSSMDDVFERMAGYSPFKDTDQVTSVDAGFNLRKDTKYGIWYFNQMASMAFPIFDSESSYFKYSGGFLRLHDFSHGFIGQLRGSYQIIPNSKHIPYLDQFQTGGLATVRGYSEGILMGKNGYFFSGELMFPLLPRTITTKEGRVRNFIGNYIKGAVFADTAGVFPWTGEDYYGGSYFLASVGMGLRVQLPGDLSARLYWGFPLVNNAYEQHRKYGRFHFELTLEPDIGGLLAKRSTKAEPVMPAPQPQPQPEPEPQLPSPNNYDDIRHYDYMLDGSATAL